MQDAGNAMTITPLIYGMATSNAFAGQNTPRVGGSSV
jgi:hypothetical protein